LAEVETDKAVVQIPSPRSGKILKMHHREGDTIKVGEVLVTIGEEGEAIAEARKEIPIETPKPQERLQKGVSVVGELEEAGEDVMPAPARPMPSLHTAPIKAMQHNLGEVLVLPSVRRLAKELKADLAKVAGTGKDGRITEEDVRRAVGGSESASEAEEIPSGEGAAPRVVRKYDMWGYIEHVPLKGIRKATAKKMVESMFTATHVSHMDEADVTDLVALREERKTAAKGIKLTYLPFIVKAVIQSLKSHQYLNASLDDAHEEIILKKYYNIGIAVDSEGGLLVPCVKRAETLDYLDIARNIQELAEKARSRQLDIMDFKGGTFTITNIGIIGGIHATPIINYPEVAILAIGQIRERPVVRTGDVVIRKIMPITVTFDHRVLDGAEAARFTADLIKLLENPRGINLSPEKD
ncbi:MAG: 2-oxo acid dehydrogenase subunit E2, partial [Candidatus Aenigmarchaeota archaeon]|nr:2-oxo acid dehydrogenase subunit E2 [Candidatus Aenigmarchaeota archaeon]